MNKLTKVLSIFVLAGVIGTGVAGVAGCNNKKSSHKHSYTYTDNADGTHNGTCTCGKDPITNEEHVDANKDNICDKEGCGATLVVNPTGATVTSVTVSGDNSVAVDGNITLTATVAGTGNPAQTVTWKSSDESKATVDANGKVTGVAEGPVKITATSTVDTTKKGEYDITVTAKGTQPGDETGIYATLVAKSNKIYNNDFATAATIDVHSGYGTTAGVYTDIAGAVAITDGAVKHNANVKDPTDSSKGSNSAIIIDFGPVASSGVFEGYMEVSADKVGSAWNLIQFKDASGATVFAIGSGTDKSKVAYVAGSGICEKLDGSTNTNVADAVVTELAFAENTVYKVYYKFDLSTGKVEMDINGTAIVVEDSGIESLGGISISSSSSGSRLVTVDNVVICGDKMSAADYKPTAKTNLETEYGKYVLEDGEDVTATHKTNAAVVTKAYNDGVAAIEAATTIDEVTEAYATAVAAMKDVIADADIETAITAAKTALAEKFPAANYSYDYAEDNDDAIYNNKGAYLAAIAEIEGQIDNGATTKSNLDKIVADATLSVEDNATKLAAKKAAVTGANGIITTYKATETEALGEEHAAHKTAIGEIRTQALTDIGNATTIDAINDIIKEAKKDIDSEIQATTASLADMIASYQGELETVGAEQKEGITETGDVKTALEAAVDDAVTAGKAAIAAVEDKANLKGVYDQEEAKVKAAIATLKATEYTVNVKKGSTTIDTLEITFGTTVKKSDIKVLAKNVDTAKIDGTDIPEDGVVITANTDIVVTLSDIDGYEGVIDWRPTVGASASAELEKNNLFTVDVTGYKTVKEMNKVIAGKTLTSSVYTDGIAQNANNADKPITITLNENLKKLVVYLTLDDGNATNNRAGTIYCVIDGGEPVEIKSVLDATNNKTDMSIAYSVSEAALKKGAVIKFYAKNVNSSNATFHMFGIDAAIDGDKVEKDVSVTWGEEEATLYHYYDVVNLPEDPVDPDGKTFIGWYYTPAGGTETKYEGGEKFPSGTTITLTPKFLSDNITLKFTVEGQENPVEETFALNTGEKGVEPAIKDPAKANNYFLGWQTSDGELVDFAQITPNADISVMKTIELTPKFAAYEKLTSEEDVDDVKSAKFYEYTAASTKPSMKAGDTLDGFLNIVQINNASWKNSSSELGLSIKNTVFKVVTDKTVTLNIAYYSPNSNRKLKVEEMNVGEDGAVTDVKRTVLAEEAPSTGNGWTKNANRVDSNNTQLTHKDIELTAGTYYITFDNVGEHKLNSISISSTSKQTIEGVVQKITAETGESGMVVKAIMLYDKKEYTVTLEESQYTVVGDLIIYGTGKTADDAHKYNSCPVPAAE